MCLFRIFSHFNCPAPTPSPSRHKSPASVEKDRSTAPFVLCLSSLPRSLRISICPVPRGRPSRHKRSICVKQEPLHSDVPLMRVRSPSLSAHFIFTYLLFVVFVSFLGCGLFRWLRILVGLVPCVRVRKFRLTTILSYR
jgi:hypothetical protein